MEDLYSESVKPAHYIGPTGSVKKSIVAEGCMIYGSVRNSVLFPGVYVSEGAEIVDSIVMSDSVIGENTQIYKCIIGEEVKVGKNVRMGIGETYPMNLNPICMIPA